MELNDHKKELVNPHDGVLVSPPAVHQGVGDALRSAFAPECPRLPNDLEELLSRLR
jgi:hypothetical protein